MQTTMRRKGSARIRHEAKVLYTLLDAADSAGLIAETRFGPQWQEVNARVLAGASFEAEAEAFHALMTELDALGIIAGTWIEERWRTIQSRVAVVI